MKKILRKYYFCRKILEFVANYYGITRFLICLILIELIFYYCYRNGVFVDSYCIENGKRVFTSAKEIFWLLNFLVFVIYALIHCLIMSFISDEFIENEREQILNILND